MLVRVGRRLVRALSINILLSPLSIMQWEGGFAARQAAQERMLRRATTTFTQAAKELLGGGSKGKGKGKGSKGKGKASSAPSASLKVPCQVALCRQ